jgi:GT2 family glycosyltransferase
MCKYSISLVGFPIVHVPLARVWHKISPSAQADSPQVHYYVTRNRPLTKWRNRRAQRRAMLQALSDTWRGRWGRQHVVAYHSVEG